jgi:hypothetical protein
MTLIGRLVSWTGLGATLVAVLSGFHGRWDDVIGAAIVVVVCAALAAVWGDRRDRSC